MRSPRSISTAISSTSTGSTAMAKSPAASSTSPLTMQAESPAPRHSTATPRRRISSTTTSRAAEPTATGGLLSQMPACRLSWTMISARRRMLTNMRFTLGLSIAFALHAAGTCTARMTDQAGRCSIRVRCWTSATVRFAGVIASPRPPHTVVTATNPQRR